VHGLALDARQVHGVVQRADHAVVAAFVKVELAEAKSK
jgi:hypothetical protein